MKSDEVQLESEKVIRDFDNHIETGFQLATFQGPLCAEPVQGMAYFVQKVEVDKEVLEKEISRSWQSQALVASLTLFSEQNKMAQVTGSVISAVRDACRNGLLDWSPRLMLAMYTCDIQASSESSSSYIYISELTHCKADVLGKVYGVVAKRRGRIVAEEVKEGTSFFNVTALLPVVESFGFSDGRVYFLFILFYD